MAKALVLLLHAAVFLTAAARAEEELPKELRDPTMFCEGCFGTISEVTEMMEAEKGHNLNARIDKVLAKVCHTDNLRKYVFSPPKMVKVKVSLPPARGLGVDPITLYFRRCAAPS